MEEIVPARSGDLLDDTPLRAPLTGTACTWWSFKVEKKSRKNSNSWHTVEKDTSVGFFKLRDDTGEILVSPLGADVIPSLTKVWCGEYPRPSGAPPTSFRSQFGSRFGSQGSRYRYTEKLMCPGEAIYALGHFETWSNVETSKELAEKRGKILAEWKANPAELLKRFDTDGDGRVDMAEWESARQAAEAIVEAYVADSAGTPDVDVLMRGEENHPFILSTKSQDELARRYRRRSLAALVLFLVSGVALGVTLAARMGPRLGA